MRIKIFITGILWLILFTAIGQKDDKDYKQRSQEVQTDIWNNAAQPFSEKKIPVAMDSESAVIIATSFDVVNTAKARLKFSGLGFGSVQRLYYQTTFHERVKINDKAALDDYSTLEYQKKLDKTASALFMKIYNKMNTYIGAKIIKPGGKEIIVNTDEEVLTKDENKRKEGKLAIPDLQVGDILDYYLRTEKLQEFNAELQGPYTFFLGGEYPIMYQSIRLQLDEKSGVQYISANGAPAFKESRDDDDNIILGLVLKDLPKLQSSMFASPYRQYPYISVQYMFVMKNATNSHFNIGVKHGSLSDNLLTQFKTILENQYLPVSYEPYNITATYFGGDKAMKKMEQDTLVKVLYNAWRHETFCSYSTQDISINNNTNYIMANSLICAISLSRMLRKMGVEHDLVLFCPRTSNSLNDVMNITDFDAIIHVKLKKDYWLSFYDVVTQFNEIPVWMQGENGLVFKPDVDARKLSYEQTGNIKIPVDSAEKNTETENMSITFNASNMQQIKIDRSTSLTGYIRHYTQKELMMTEDIESSLAVAINEKKLTERFAEDKKQKKLVDEFSAAFTKERINSKSYFENEIKNQYDQPAKQVIAYEIKDAGLFNSDFIYHTNFTMDNFVKKAGNNYIIEAGKLMGSLNKVEEKDRTRKIDIYTPCARMYTYNISLEIPKGYKVKGIENFNKNISNETGSLKAAAIADDSAVHINIQQLYARNFEPAANWSKMLELMDGLYDMSNQKLLLEKAN